jgi:hypothetical protein
MAHARPKPHLYQAGIRGLIRPPWCSTGLRHGWHSGAHLSALVQRWTASWASVLSRLRRQTARGGESRVLGSLLLPALSALYQREIRSVSATCPQSLRARRNAVTRRRRHITSSRCTTCARWVPRASASAGIGAPSATSQQGVSGASAAYQQAVGTTSPALARHASGCTSRGWCWQAGAGAASLHISLHVGRQLATSRPSADHRRTISGIAADCQQSVSRRSAEYPQTVGRVSANYQQIAG